MSLADYETEAAAVASLALTAAEPTFLDAAITAAAFVVPEGATVQVSDFEAFAGQPRRKTGTVRLASIESLADYVNLHQPTQAGEAGAPTVQTVVYADPSALRFVAVLNDHERDRPGHGDHQAIFTLEKSAEWKHWERLDGKLVDLATFAEHIEWGISTILSPLGADMLELAQSMEGSVSARFGAGTRLATGERRFLYTEETTATAGRNGELTIPAEIKLGVKAFEGVDPVYLTARFRYRVNNGSLTVGYQLIRPDVVLREEFDSRRDWLADNIGSGDGAPIVLLGTPPG